MKLTKEERVHIVLALGEFASNRANLLSEEQRQATIDHVEWALKEAQETMSGKRVSSALPSIVRGMEALVNGEGLEAE